MEQLDKGDPDYQRHRKAANKRAHTDRMRALGLVPVQVWVHKDDAKQVKRLGRELIDWFYSQARKYGY